MKSQLIKMLETSQGFLVILMKSSNTHSHNERPKVLTNGKCKYLLLNYHDFAKTKMEN